MPSNDLFGVKFQDIIGKAFAGKLVAMTLTSVTVGTRDPADPLAGTEPTTADVATEGILESYKEHEIRTGLAKVGDKKALILAKPLGSTVPKPGDTLTVSSVGYRVVQVDRDPAIATYTLRVRA